MNKYASGYTGMGIISFVGGTVILISLIGGLVMAINGPSGMGYIGLIVAVSGTVQGFLLLGVGSIGSAILDGSMAQQEMAVNLSKKDAVAPQRERDDLTPYLLSAALGIPGGIFLESYKGSLIIQDAVGSILVGTDVFSSVSEAKMKIDSSKIEITSTIEDMSFEADGSLIFRGYRIPKKGNEFLLNGLAYTNPQKVAEKIIDETDSSLSKYRIYKPSGLI